MEEGEGRGDEKKRVRDYFYMFGHFVSFRHDREHGIKYRKDESVGGWFSQIGEMHQVHHLWGMCVCPAKCFRNNIVHTTCTYVQSYVYVHTNAL